MLSVLILTALLSTSLALADGLLTLALRVSPRFRRAFRRLWKKWGIDL